MTTKTWNVRDQTNKTLAEETGTGLNEWEIIDVEKGA